MKNEEHEIEMLNNCLVNSVYGLELRAELAIMEATDYGRSRDTTFEQYTDIQKALNKFVKEYRRCIIKNGLEEKYRAAKEESVRRAAEETEKFIRQCEERARKRIAEEECYGIQ